MAFLLVKKIIGLAKYSDFANVFLKKSANIFLEQTVANKHAIKLEKGKQPCYGPIYCLGPIELKTLKTYIKTNLANSFIKALKPLAGAPILSVHTSNGSFCLCINYQRLNNLINKNWYPLPLIGKFLDWLGWAKQFTQFDLTNTYYWIKIKEDNKWKIDFWTWYGHFKY